MCYVTSFEASINLFIFVFIQQCGECAPHGWEYRVNKVEIIPGFVELATPGWGDLYN